MDAEPMVSGVFLLERSPGKGGWTYTVVPRTVRLTRPGGWLQVSGTIDGYALNKVKLAPLRGERMFFAVKASIRKQIGKEAGQHVELILHVDDPDFIPETGSGNEEIMESFRFADVDKQFLSRSEQEQQQLIDWIQASETIENKIERINAVIDRLMMTKS